MPEPEREPVGVSRAIRPPPGEIRRRRRWNVAGIGQAVPEDDEAQRPVSRDAGETDRDASRGGERAERSTGSGSLCLTSRSGPETSLAAFRSPKRLKTPHRRARQPARGPQLPGTARVVPPVPRHAQHLAEQLVRRDRQVLVAMGIAPGHGRRARHPRRPSERRGGRRDGDRGRTARCRRSDLLDSAALDDNHHAAGSPGACSRRPPGCGRRRSAQGLGDERRGGRRQEDFLTALHGPLVGFILPQASAIVSKTCSRVNAGFSVRLLGGFLRRHGIAIRIG